MVADASVFISSAERISVVSGLSTIDEECACHG